MPSIENISSVASKTDIKPEEKKQQPTQKAEEKKIEIPQDLIDLTKEFSKDTPVPAKTVRLDEKPAKKTNIDANYEYLKLDRNGVNDTVGGISISAGTQIWDITKYLKLSAEANGHLVGSGNSLGIQAGGALKTFVGTKFNAAGYADLPIGAYIKAGPTLNVTNIKGDTSAGIGASLAAGVNLAGLNVEATKDFGTNYNSYGFRVGVSVNF